MTHKIFRLVSSLFLALAVLGSGLNPQPVRAAGPWYVTPGGNDANGCLSPGTACATINGALNKPGFVAGDTIRVAIGTYTGTGNEVVLLDKNASLAGGWNASFTTQSGMSTIDGQASRRGITVNNGVTATIERMVVQNGNSGEGGGIYNAGTLALNNSAVSGNSTSVGGYGGGIYSFGPLTLNNSTISSNTSYYDGGGILNASFLTLTNSTVSNNIAGDLGGGIYNPSGTLTLDNSIVKDNSTVRDGAAGRYGGGIFNGSNPLTLNNSTVSDNTTGFGGGGIMSQGTLLLNNSTVSGNKATMGTGGGILNTWSVTALYNSTITGNTAASGSGGGGIQSDHSGGGASGTIELHNSILADNTGGPGPDCLGHISVSDHNIIGNIDSCTVTPGAGDQFNVDPLLGPLQDNGGPTFTHALLSGSPAIDAGNPAGCTDQNGDSLTTDQRGVVRPQGTRCDIGAFELEADGGGGTEVSIDIKPGRFPNRIKLTRNVCRDDDNLYVAILTTPSFNARTVDVSTLQLGDPNLSGKATPYRSRVTDVDRDGDRDLVLTFSLCSIVTNGALNASSTKLVLTGRTLDGNNFTGTDSVKVVR